MRVITYHYTIHSHTTIPCIPVDKDITLSVSHTELNTSGDWIVVSWSGVKDPGFLDWIGVYVLDKSGETIDPKSRTPIKYQVKTTHCFE